MAENSKGKKVQKEMSFSEGGDKSSKTLLGTCFFFKSPILGTITNHSTKGEELVTM